MFDGDSKAWNYSVPVTVPIFTAGRIKGEVQAAEAVQQQTLINYQSVIQNAFREVEDALVDQDRTRVQLEAQGEQVAALQDYARLARLRYEEGYASYIEVLDAERSLFNVELEYTQTKSELFRALVDLYKAMGGGWVATAENMTISESSENQEDTLQQ